MALPPRPKRPLTAERKAEARTADYDTGYGKPPTTARFQKGQSGNPAGRPKGSKSMKTDLISVLDIEVQVQLPSGPETVSMQKAMILAAAAKATKGDTRAAMVIIRLMEIVAPERLKEAAESVKLSANDEALLSNLLAGMGLGDAPPPVGSPSLPLLDDAESVENDDDWEFAI